ncbi:MAG: amidohydrolase family protein [Sphingomonadaceae bacterium]|nr:amidohydrolase family protein [Sphingomonadaceae bacterium]
MASPAFGEERLLVVDMHAHFFNAADLPIAGFGKHVLQHGELGRHRAGRAVIDLLAGLVQRIAADADEELTAIGQGEEWTPETFGTASAEFVESRTSELESRGTAGDPDLVRSYQDLTAALAADAGYDAALVANARTFSLAESGSDAQSFQRQLNAYSFAAVANKVESAAFADPGVVLEHRSSTEMNIFGDWEIPILGEVSRSVGWAYLMGKTRRSHIMKFLESYSGESATPGMAVNHLVDYDYWLDDTPAEGSAPLKQVQVFSRLSEQFADRVDIRTFAGFCPLRHAIETLGGDQILFDQYKPLVASGAIAGFKMYPPMGFRPWNNAALNDEDFDPQGRAPRTALDRWQAAGGTSDLCRALDDSLAQFYQWCADNAVPIMAHAGSGNEAGDGFGQRANPVWWEPVASQYPIRLSLGHLVNNAEPFVEAVRQGPPYRENVWALHGSRRLLDKENQAIRAEVYGDLGYMPELIDNPRLAADFFKALLRVFGDKDSDLSRILYGSDWIMLGRERHYERNLDQMINGMRAARYTPAQQENILFRNARRFLRL